MGRLTAGAVWLLLCALRLGEEPQHLRHHGLEGQPQLLAAVGLLQRGHVHKATPALPRVQRRVVGVVTEVPGVDRTQREGGTC